MAKQNIDKLMEKAIKAATDSWARSGVDKSDQKVTVTNHNLREAFKEAFSKSHQKEFPGRDIPFSDPDAVFRKAGNEARKALIKHLQNKRTGSYLHGDTAAHKVVFTQTRAIKSPFRIMKKAGANYINKELKKVGAKPLSEGQHQDINLGMQRLHQGVTVGVARLKKVIDVFEQNELGEKFFSSEIGISFLDNYKDILASFELTKDKKGKNTIRYIGEVNVLVQRKGKNFAGSDINDFKKVAKRLNKDLAIWLRQADIANIPGSQSIAEEARDAAQMLVMQTLTKGKFVNSKRPIAKAKSKAKKGSAEKVRKKPKSTRNVKAAVIQRAKKQTASMQPLQLIGLINKSLPDTVRKNMQAPGLQNRTGRFAESVKLTDVVQTGKGFPSFGYTYQKNPYQVFEMGSGQAPWASAERDPRKLIDRSIREIAAQFAIGRFYTRRE